MRISEASLYLSISEPLVEVYVKSPLQPPSLILFDITCRDALQHVRGSYYQILSNPTNKKYDVRRVAKYVI
jgi:hypothetical protein